MKHILWISILFASSILWGTSPTPTPTATLTPQPRIQELICDAMNITTEAFNISKETNRREFTFLDIRAKVSSSVTGLNLYSTSLVNEDGEYVKYIDIENEGSWRVLRDSGSIYFTPTIDFNGTSSVQYVVNNNCDYPVGLSNKATATVTINAPSGPLPLLDGVCLFAQEGEAKNDMAVMHRGEKLKVINVFDNDDNGLEEATKFVNASLRVLDPDKGMLATRRVYVKNKGTWLANTNTGQIFFIPDENFVGSTQITYIADSPCTYDANQETPPGSHAQAYSAQITVVGPTPTPTPVPTPTATPKPTPKPIPIVAPTSAPATETSTSQTQVTTDEIETDSSPTLGRLSLFLLMIFTLGIGLVYIKKEEG